MHKLLAENFVTSYRSKSHYCFFCDFHFDDALDHINRQSHQENKELPNKTSLIAENGISARPTFFHCSSCNAKLYTFGMTKIHVKSKKHVGNKDSSPKSNQTNVNQSHRVSRARAFNNSRISSGTLDQAARSESLMSNQNAYCPSKITSRNANPRAPTKGPKSKPSAFFAESFEHNPICNDQKRIPTTDQHCISLDEKCLQGSSNVANYDLMKDNPRQRKKKYMPPVKIQNSTKESIPLNGISGRDFHPLKGNLVHRVLNPSDEINCKRLIHGTKKMSLDTSRDKASRRLKSGNSDSDSSNEEDTDSSSKVGNGDLQDKHEPILLNSHFQYYFNYIRSQRKNIRKVKNKTYRCGPCSRNFDGIISAFHHSNDESHKKKLKEDPGTEHYFCKPCEAYLTKDETLLQCHLLYHGRNKSSNLNDDIVGPNESKKIKIECLLCGPIKNDKKLAEHVKSFEHKQKLNSLVSSPKSDTPLVLKEDVENGNSKSLSYDPKKDICIKSFCYVCYQPIRTSFDPGSNLQKIKEKKSKNLDKKPNPHEETHCIKDVEDETHFFRCFLCDIPFQTHDLLKNHYLEPDHKYRLQTVHANLDQSSDYSDESSSSWVTLDDACSDILEGSYQEKKHGKAGGKSGERSTKTGAKLDKLTSTEKVTNENNSSESKRPKKPPKLRAKGRIPHNENLLRLGKNHVFKCLEPGEDNIYNEVLDMNPVLQRGIDFIYPSKTCNICLVCDFTFPTQLQHLFEHLQHEVHLENLRTLEECKTTTEDEFDHLDIAESCMKEKVSGESIECLACGFSIEDSDDVIKTHINSQQHIVKIQHWKMSLEPIKLQVSDVIKNPWYFAQRFICQICQCVLNKEAVFVSHLEDPNHLKNCVQLSQKKNKVNICYICSLCWYGSPDHSQHFNDEMHKRAMKKRTGMLPKMSYDSKVLLASAERKVEKLIQESDAVIQSQKGREEALLKDIEDTVKTKYPLAKAYMFGSRISYTCSANSDADVFLDCENIYYEVGSKKKSQEYIKAVRNFFTSQKGATSGSQWKKVNVLTSPRVPIIRLQHVSTGLKCDLSFLSGLSTEKSKLIRNYIVADERCRKLILFLKKWFNACDLYGSRAVNCYALSWYAIFFMQIKGIFPSVDQITIKNEAKAIDGWQCHYNEKVPVQPSNATFKDLLKEFFLYYAKFDYQTSVACPLVGRAIKKSLFTNFDDLPAEMGTYKNRMKTEEMEIFRFDSPMCIQDPVDLTQNITKAVYKPQLRSFRSYCLESHAELCK
ncbi:hypothetical protein QAD02_006560 [Eretmocerus hayati]|uniref:Uncharacterized protein n=1 Tax=Eretmocerus hayati TaxID=131215 RepID=A0ACC2N1A0_9HYME|nr:hypothetical protein QAD02_006560 [Eretmocerus hayati]